MGSRLTGRVPWGYFPRLPDRWRRSSAVEQGNHNPLVGGSNPPAATISRQYPLHPETGASRRGSDSFFWTGSTSLRDQPPFSPEPLTRQHQRCRAFRLPRHRGARREPSREVWEQLDCIAGVRENRAIAKVEVTLDRQTLGQDHRVGW